MFTKTEQISPKFLVIAAFLEGTITKKLPIRGILNFILGSPDTWGKRSRKTYCQTQHVTIRLTPFYQPSILYLSRVYTQLVFSFSPTLFRWFWDFLKEEKVFLPAFLLKSFMLICFSKCNLHFQSVLICLVLNIKNTTKMSHTQQWFY